MRSAQKILSWTGFISCLAGACLLFIASLPALRQEIQPTIPGHASAVYVSADSCFTCHEDLQFEWSQPLHPLEIGQPLVNPLRTVYDEGAQRSTTPVGRWVDSLAMRALSTDALYLSDDGYAESFSSNFTSPAIKEENLP